MIKGELVNADSSFFMIQRGLCPFDPGIIKKTEPENFQLCFKLLA